MNQVSDKRASNLEPLGAVSPVHFFLHGTLAPSVSGVANFLHSLCLPGIAASSVPDGAVSPIQFFLSTAHSAARKQACANSFSGVPPGTMPGTCVGATEGSDSKPVGTFGGATKGSDSKSVGKFVGAKRGSDSKPVNPPTMTGVSHSVLKQEPLDLQQDAPPCPLGSVVVPEQEDAKETTVQPFPLRKAHAVFGETLSSLQFDAEMLLNLEFSPTVTQSVQQQEQHQLDIPRMILDIWC